MIAALQTLRNSKFREMVWPIRSYELLKFIPMALLMFGILLNQNLLRNIKDGVVVTMVGPEVISFIKLWCEMPAGVLFVILYTKMCNIMTTESAFRAIVVAFLSFFFAFTFFIFPNAQSFHPDPEYVNALIQQMPHIKWFIVIWSKWSYILFYVMGELWPVIMFSLLFWQLANKITATQQASRFYSFFCMFGQSNLIVSGQLISYFASSDDHILAPFFGLQSHLELTVKAMMVVVLLSGVTILGLHYFIEKKIMTDERHYQPRTTDKVMKLGLIESAKIVLTSRYLGMICALIVCYGTCVNLIEGVWMSKVRALYPSTTQFMLYHGQVATWTGTFTICFAFVGNTIIRQFGWYYGAIITPVAVLVFSGLFFLSASLETQVTYLWSMLTTVPPLYMMTLLGGAQNVLSKGAKYSLFDATKEMAYIPLEDELKTKGKAAVEVVGSKLGKSSSAIMQFLAFTMIPNATYAKITPMLSVVFFASCLLWLTSVRGLAAEYRRMLAR